MRKNIVAGNWKMNLKRDEGLNLVNDVINLLPSDNEVEVVFAPSFIYLYKVNKMCLNLDRVSTASQNISKEERGAFTGEVSAEMIRSINVKYAIIYVTPNRANKLIILLVKYPIKVVSPGLYKCFHIKLLLGPP